MTADNNSTEDKPDPTPFKVYPTTNEGAQQAHAGPAHQGICLQGAGYQICRSPSRRVLRGLSARQENLALATGATYELYSEANYSLNAKGLDSQAAEPRSPRPRSPAKTSGPWRKLAEMNGSRFDCFNEQVWPHQDAEGHLHDRASSSLDLMPPARVIAGPRATPHFHSACYEGALSGIGGWRANPRT
jgi:hypothetical protein